MQLSRPTKSTFGNLWQASAAVSLLKHVPAALGLRVAMGLVPLMRMSLRVPVDPAVAATGTAEAGCGVTPSTGLSEAGWSRLGERESSRRQGHPDAIVLVKSFGGTDVRKGTRKEPLSWAKEENHLTDAFHWGGPPCQSLSGLNAERTGIEDQRSRRMDKRRCIDDALAYAFPLAAIHAGADNVASKSKSDRQAITKIRCGFPLVMCGPGPLSWCRRKRLCWLTVPVNATADAQHIIEEDRARLADIQLILMPSWLPKERTTAWSAVQLTCAVWPLVARSSGSPSLMQRLQGSGPGRGSRRGGCLSHGTDPAGSRPSCRLRGAKATLALESQERKQLKLSSKQRKDKSLGTGQGDAAERPAATLQPAPMAQASFRTAERSAQAPAAEPPAKVMAPKCHDAVNAAWKLKGQQAKPMWTACLIRVSLLQPADATAVHATHFCLD